MRFNITIPAGGTTRRFHYNVELISANFEVTSLQSSDPCLVGF